MKKYIFPVAFIIFIAVSKWYENLHNLQILGITLDVTGAYYLAQSFIVKSNKDILRDSHGVDRSMSTNLAVSFYIQKYEALTGFLILTAGFLCQGYSVIHQNFEVNPKVSLTIIIGVFFISTLAHCYLLEDKRILKRLKL